MDSDKPIKDTSIDAVSSRWSACMKGYLKDKYIDLFYSGNEIKPPMINRGTFIRTYTIDKLISSFIGLEICKVKSFQIVSLGAGMDTRIFNLKEEFLGISSSFKFFEIDFEDIANKKISKITSTHLKSLFDGYQLNEQSTSLFSKNYSIIGGDIKNFKQQIYPVLIDNGLDTSIPTLFLAECSLVYIEPDLVDEVLHLISSSFDLAIILSYEQILTESPFSQMMLNNLKRRNIILKGISKYPTLQNQRERYVQKGFPLVEYFTVWEIEKKLLNQDIIDKLNKIERLDEIEEWRMLADHYAFFTAIKLPSLKDGDSHQVYELNNLSNNFFFKKAMEG